MNGLWLHRILVKNRVDEAMDLLRRHGYKPWIADRHEHFGTAIDFEAPRDETLDFLRPMILPPRKK